MSGKYTKSSGRSLVRRSLGVAGVLSLLVNVL